MAVDVCCNSTVLVAGRFLLGYCEIVPLWQQASVEITRWHTSLQKWGNGTSVTVADLCSVGLSFDFQQDKKPKHLSRLSQWQFDQEGD